METKMFFSILAFLLIAGTAASLFSPAGLSGLPSAPTLNLAIFSTTGAAAPTSCAVCTDGGLFGLACIADALACLATTVVFMAIALILFIVVILNLIVSLGIFAAQLAVFFTGLSAIMNGSVIALPQPFGFIFTILLLFGWMMVGMEFIRRFKAMVAPQ